jgi:hypothetical protein
MVARKAVKLRSHQTLADQYERERFTTEVKARWYSQENIHSSYVHRHRIRRFLSFSLTTIQPRIEITDAFSIIRSLRSGGGLVVFGWGSPQFDRHTARRF